MTEDEAEAILALADEVRVGLELSADELAFRGDSAWDEAHLGPVVDESGSE